MTSKNWIIDCVLVYHSCLKVLAYNLLFKRSNSCNDVSNSREHSGFLCLLRLKFPVRNEFIVFTLKPEYLVLYGGMSYQRLDPTLEHILHWICSKDLTHRRLNPCEPAWCIHVPDTVYSQIFFFISHHFSNP